MNATQTLGSSRALGSALDAPTRLYSRSYPRRYSYPCVGSAAAVPLPTVKEDQESSFSYDKVKAFTSGALLGSPFALFGQLLGSSLRMSQMGRVALDLFSLLAWVWASL